MGQSGISSVLERLLDQEIVFSRRPWLVRTGPGVPGTCSLAYHKTLSDQSLVWAILKVKCCGHMAVSLPALHSGLPPRLSAISVDGAMLVADMLAPEPSRRLDIQVGPMASFVRPFAPITPLPRNPEHP